MPGGKDDRRVRYTKMVLKESFVRLLSEKDISKITIKEICEVADINRATFYAHYSSQYDLLHKIEDELIENITAHLSSHSYDVEDESTIDMVVHIFEYIRENAQLCKLLFSERGDLDFQKKIMTLIYDKNFSDLIFRHVVLGEDTDYVHAFIITGCVGIIQKWLNDDMKMSVRKLSELLVRLSLNLSRAN